MIRRVLVMSSSGFASSTMKSALLPASIVPRSVSFSNSRRVAGRRDDHLRRRHACRHHVGHLEWWAQGMPPSVPSAICTPLRSASPDSAPGCRTPAAPAGRSVAAAPAASSAPRPETLSLNQLRSVCTPRSGRFGMSDEVLPLLHHRHELVVDVLVAHAVSESRRCLPAAGPSHPPASRCER